jgi:translation elongation factor EF-Tu-like GTPase
MSRKIVRAQLHLLETRDGGRTERLVSGYRSLLRFEGNDTDFGFELNVESGRCPESIAPGSAGSVRLSLWAIAELPTLSVGQKFEVREGTRIVGHGEIIDTDNEAK